MDVRQTSRVNKFQRTYLVQIQGQDGKIYSFGSEDGQDSLLTLEFMVNRNLMASAQTGRFIVRNLNPSTRSLIYKDWYDTGRWPLLIVKAGYSGTPLSTIFKGVAFQVNSYRAEGAVDFVTEIEGQSYGVVMSNSFSSWTMGSASNPVTQEDILKQLIKDLQTTAETYGHTLGIGVVGGFTKNRYTFTAHDHTWNILQTETERLSFIDNGKIYCMPNNYVFEGDVSLINSETGLLGTPRKHDSFLDVDIVFEPSIIPGQLIYLQTSLTPALNSLYNGLYKVTGIQHLGIISSAMSGECKTTLTLQLNGTPFLARFGL